MLSQTGCRASGACARGVIDHVCVALALQAVAEEARGTCVAPWCGRQADCKPASPKEPAQQAEASGEADGGREAAAQEAKPIQDGGVWLASVRAPQHTTDLPDSWTCQVALGTKREV